MPETEGMEEVVVEDVEVLAGPAGVEEDILVVLIRRARAMTVKSSVSVTTPRLHPLLLVGAAKVVRHKKEKRAYVDASIVDNR